MSFLPVIGFGLKLGHLLLVICCWPLSVISLKWYRDGEFMDSKSSSLRDFVKKWLKLWEKISHHHCYQYIGTKRVRKTLWRNLLVTWVVFWMIVSFSLYRYMSSKALEKRKETLASMCEERARMLQDQFNVSMNHIHAMSILISTFHHGVDPSSLDQMTFASYTGRTAFERPLTSGVAYAVRVLHSEREQFERKQGWTIKRMNNFEHNDEFDPEALEPSPVEEEYAPVVFAQDTIAHVISIDMLSGKEDRENVLRSRASGKGVLTAPFRLIKSNRLGVILTFPVYNIDLPSSVTVEERIQATHGYLGGVFDIESLVEKLLQQLASKQKILVNVSDITNSSHPITMYGSYVYCDELQHVSSLNFGDPFRKHEMRCRFQQKPPWPRLAIMTSIGILVIALLVGYIFDATVNRIAKVEDDYHEMMELKKRAEAADVAKSQFLATVSHEIRTPMNGVLGMLRMLMDTDLDGTQEDYVRTAQGSGKALVSLINEVLDQAKIESGKLELEAVQFDVRVALDDVLSLFSGKSQEKGLELAVYISEKVPEMLVGDPGRFRQIITNLVGNSIKFTEKGHIFVTVHLAEEVMESLETETLSLSENTLSGFPVADRRQSWGGFRTLSQDEPTSSCSSLTSDLINLIVSVEDTGVGIPLEARPRVFTPFMQVDHAISRLHGGTGIGLSISKFLVGLMNGEIGFSSVHKIGSTFTFTAVFTNGCSHTSETKDQQLNNPVSSAFRGMTALLVDPRPVRAKVSRYHIQRLGVHVDVVPNLDQDFSGTGSGNTAIDMVFIEQEVWNKDLGSSSLVVNKLHQLVPPKLFILSNSILYSRSGSLRTSRDRTFPTVIVKPLRANMLAASLQRAMGVGTKGSSLNGELSGPFLGNLLLGRKILVVDDNQVNLIVAAAALKKYGADVICVDSGKRAISHLKPPHKLDACFMDIQMPEVDGFEATKRIRDMELSVNSSIKNGELSVEDYNNVSDWHVPILAMTADVIQATHEECLKWGMDGYVSKPFEAEQLYGEVSRFLCAASDHSRIAS